MRYYPDSPRNRHFRSASPPRRDVEESDAWTHDNYHKHVYESDPISTGRYTDATIEKSNYIDSRRIKNQRNLPPYGEEYTKRVRYLAHNDGRVTSVGEHFVSNPDYLCRRKGCCAFSKPSPAKKAWKPSVRREPPCRTITPASYGRFPFHSALAAQNGEFVDENRFSEFNRVQRLNVSKPYNPFPPPPYDTRQRSFEYEDFSGLRFNS